MSLGLAGNNPLPKTNFDPRCNMAFIELNSCDWVDTLRPRQNGLHFVGEIFKRIILKENVWIPIKFSIKLVHKGLINNIPALVKIMAWYRPSHYLKQVQLDFRRIYASLSLNGLFRTIMGRYLSPSVTPGCMRLLINPVSTGDVYMRPLTGSSLAQLSAFRQVNTLTKSRFIVIWTIGNTLNRLLYNLN